MARRKRSPVAGQLVEVTCRTLQSRLLLTPSPTLNAILLGILGRAQRLFGMTLCAAVVLSNHLHLLVVPCSAEQLSGFMQFLNGNIARKVGRLIGWNGRFWDRRYQAIPVSDEPKAQIARLRYLLSHGAKENLVRRPEDWPGLQFVRELLTGVSRVFGYWHNQTAESKARRRGEKIKRRRFLEQEVVVLSPLPCWQNCTPEEIKQKIEELLAGIQAEIDEQRRQEGTRPLGVDRVRRQRPSERPLTTKRSPAPLVHAASAQVRRQMREAYRRFAAAYREASARLRRGERDVEFPPGCFPPRLPFVPEVDPSPA